MRLKKIVSIFLVVFSVLVSVQPAFAQAGPIEWTYYDDATGDRDCRSILTTEFTSDSAYARIDSNGNSYCYGQVWGETYVENISQVTFNWSFFVDDPYCNVEIQAYTDSPYSTDFYLYEDTNSGNDDFSGDGSHTIQLPPGYTGKVSFYISVDVAKYPATRSVSASIHNITFQ
ncbi:hypothetical protein GCM10023310_17940 [Paenibacillus vulneris]|uniref:Uncharacterized protein n=1 Tax=Paenibacillus vulneris TaxID=1133364 RepID=A0ABW3UKA6_9BACL|nr:MULTISPECIES: hypothetical protein [unclassified Paenibacillus]MBE1444788.1 hypothetical protein [Paenibacillus sp. OAS669]